MLYHCRYPLLTLLYLFAAFLAAGAGVGLSYVVEANHKGYPKELAEKEMDELRAMAGLTREGADVVPQKKKE
jgi:hypothetical protein